MTRVQGQGDTYEIRYLQRFGGWASITQQLFYGFDLKIRRLSSRGNQRHHMESSWRLRLKSVKEAWLS